MPTPIPEKYNFEIKHNKFFSLGDMPTMVCSSDHYSIGFVISGDRKTIMQNHIFELHRGEVGLGMPNVLHRTCSLSEKAYERILIKFTYPMAEDFIKLVGTGVFEHLYQIHSHRFSLEIQDKIKIMMLDMVNEFEDYDTYSEVILKGMLTRLLLTIAKYTTAKVLDSKNNFCQMKEIVQATNYMNEKLVEDIKLPDVAAYVNLSAAHFSKLFKKTMGATFSQYLSDIRLQKSLQYLVQTEETITEIAFLCGFSCGNYYCDVFKNKFLISPTDYRRKAKQKKLKLEETSFLLGGDVVH